MSYKVCFRGDSRYPTDLDAIFRNGFHKRNPMLAIRTRGMGPHRAGDIDPVSAVCMSARISAAALFPLFTQPPAPIGPNYLYMMALDTARIFNTHSLQVQVSLASPGLASDPENVMWPLFAQELAADDVSPRDIIAAVAFTRAFFGVDWKAGGTYTLGTVILQNASCTVPDEVRSAAMKFLESEVASYRVGQPLPTIRSGYHLSTGR